jgi:hypothetical protein
MALFRSFSLHLGAFVLRLGDTDDKHHLVVGTDHVSVDATGLWVDWATALVIQLLGSPIIGLAFSRNNIVVWRTSLKLMLAPGSEPKVMRSTHQRLRRQGSEPTHFGNKNGQS